MIVDLNSPWPYLATAAFIASMGMYAWRQPRRPGTRYFNWMLGLWAAWALAAALATLVQPNALRYGLAVLQGVIALLVAPLELVVVLEYTGYEKWLARRNFLLLMSLPALSLALMVLVSPISSMVFIESHAGVEVLLALEWIKWVYFTYILIIEITVIGILLTSLFRAPAFRVPAALLILGLTIPKIGYVAIDPQLFTVSPIQAAILWVNVTALAYFVALYSFGMLRVVPIARDVVINSMPYAMLVLDADDRLVDFNGAARALPVLPGKLKLRQPAMQALGVWWEKLAPLVGSTPAATDVSIQTNPAESVFYVQSLPLLQANGWQFGHVFVLEDVTHTRQAQRRAAQTLWAQATLEEREQLADELHDGLSQSLAFLNLQAQAAQVNLKSGNNEAAQANLERLSEAAGEIQMENRELIGELLAVSQPAANFCDTLRNLLTAFEQQTGLATCIEIDPKPGGATDDLCSSLQLPSPAAVQLVRISQEALANVRKHAEGASRVDVQLAARDGHLLLTIADDGDGFDPAAAKVEGRHFGLQVMRQRAVRLGGQVQIDSMSGKGTRIVVCVPCESF